ncbi:DUF1552 domain-containing protein [Bradyrhizobium sp. ISRA443]|uniref:DUF1552 domain-containing protein n=1 Tax=unclassified Bradyrhizobium TaxID=2631580 RepID=UPI00247ABAA9|nr:MULTISPECIES: DUF1552 domain-containing protein [unclassified Bradyrhizobium]WGR97888.1 DUF1552 domain-containing protein [Bradyrhizobium sp. ISRA436]WGS04778.1 DUF1552 domain-containing protein [Bradyrhizobium sp. ISRA437]WGS11659.1 DUF1552 domain-containing protein [Bradyrhizobium sp. ISRA443]
MFRKIDRRQVLRGILGGTAVTVGMPFLECFLNDGGTALANGRPLPVRFGTWFWGLGMNREIFVPETTGANFDLKEELAAIRPVRDHINLFTRYRTFTDGRPSLCHYTGWVTLRCGQAPADRKSVPGESLDVTISDAIGGSTRFRSLEMTATGNRQHSYSFRNAQAVNPPEISPLAFYQRVFGPEFQDPNSPVFHPNPRLMVRESVLSAVLEDSASLKQSLGAADRARLDQYFTSLRDLEQRLALQLEKPPPAPACRVPSAPADVTTIGEDADLVAQRHRLMTDILVAALSCDQTRVFNMGYSESFAATTRKTVPNSHHSVTHEEHLNKQGYQAMHSWFIRRAMDEWAYFVGALASVREGDRTLLDNALVFAHSDHEQARVHSLDGIPMMTAGRAGGRMKSGVHVAAGAEDVGTQIGLTVMRAMGLQKSEWGFGSMKTSKVVGEVLQA